MVTPTNEAAVDFAFLLPIEFRQTALQRAGIIAAVIFGIRLKGRDMRDVIGHLAFGHEIAAAKLDAVEFQIGADQIEHPLTEEIRLVTPRPAIRARRRLVRELNVRFEMNVRNTIRPGHELHDIARSDQAVGPDVSADIAPGIAA